VSRVWQCQECGSVKSVAVPRVWQCQECGSVKKLDKIAYCRASSLVLLATYYKEVKFKRDKKGGACDTHTGEKMCIQDFL
jgi:hypothetical protein